MKQPLGYYVRILIEKEKGLDMFLEAYKKNQDIRCHLMPEISVIREDYFNDILNDVEEGYQDLFTYMTIDQIEEVTEK